jgi:hypothetical protein
VHARKWKLYAPTQDTALTLSNVERGIVSIAPSV